MGGPVGLNTTLPSFARLPSPVRSFASGTYDARRMVWRKAVQEGRIDRARAQRAVEHLVTASRSRVDRFGEFNADEVRASLLFPAAQPEVQIDTGGGTYRAGSNRRILRAEDGGRSFGASGIAVPPASAELIQLGLGYLRSGDIAAFNELRRSHNAWRPDLRRADLKGLKLDGVDLSMADLREADLTLASLKGASLSGADLSGADLSGAELSSAFLGRYQGVGWVEGESVIELRRTDLSGVRGLTVDQLVKNYGPLREDDVIVSEGPEAAVVAEVIRKQWEIWNEVSKIRRPSGGRPNFARIRFFRQLESLGLDADAMERWRIAPPSEELGQKVKEHERRLEGKELRELTEIADGAYHFVIDARGTLDRLTTPEERDLVKQKIDEQLALLVAINNILTNRGF